MPASFDLWKLIFNPEANSNPLRMAFKVTTLLKESSQRKIVSSANWRMHTSISFLPNLRPVSKVVLLALLTIQARP